MPTKKITDIAHRGASSYAPENTIAAFDLALQMGAIDTELDVDFTSDSHVVVIRDETVDRTTNGIGHVDKKRLEQVKYLDVLVPGLVKNSLVSEYRPW